jgi:glycosyltransferase involved in cell wall biosynthesis
VHTVHNVVPHERGAHDHAPLRDVYRAARALIVHSQYAQRALEAAFPFTADRIIVEPHGGYTTYPPPAVPSAQLRAKLDIPRDAIVVLAFGWIRPYKNIDRLVRALALLRGEPFVLVIAGREGSGFPDRTRPGADPLTRMRALAADVGVTNCVRFCPGVFSEQATTNFFGAADIVAMPYEESWGSGQLLLAMTLGRYVVTTRAGGAYEYLEDYTPHTLINGTTPEAIARALQHAAQRLPKIDPADRHLPPRLTWDRISADTLEALDSSVRRR